MAVGLQRSGDWLVARRSDQCAAPPANHRCAVGLLTAIAAREFRLLKLILHSELRRRAASRRALPCTFSLLNFLARCARSIAFYTTLRNESRQCAIPTPFIRPPGTPFRTGLYSARDVFVFFRHAFSETPQPIALKLCHMIRIWLYFIN